MKVYISGKMTGLPDLGKPQFDEAEALLKSFGHVAINPAWIGSGLPRTAYMPMCMAMLQQADAIYLLDNWMDSPGARLEREFAEYQGLEILTRDTLLPDPEALAEKEAYERSLEPEGFAQRVRELIHDLGDRKDYLHEELAEEMLCALAHAGYGDAVREIRACMGIKLPALSSYDSYAGDGEHTYKLTLMQEDYTGHIYGRVGGNTKGTSLLTYALEALDDPEGLWSDCEFQSTCDDDDIYYRAFLHNGEDELDCGWCSLSEIERMVVGVEIVGFEVKVQADE